MRIALALLVMLGACEPDYSDTAFLCDTTRGCPEGQTCQSGRCHRGSVVGAVACGAGLTCMNGQQCCVDSQNLPRCIPGGDECPNGYGALCDGLADCEAGDACCDGDLTYCHATCGDSLSTICTVDTDCPSGYPHCCIDPAVVPWGTCQFRACGQ